MSTQVSSEGPVVRQRAVFADATEMKEQVRKAMARPQQDITNFFHTRGWSQAVARHVCFEYLTLVVIFVNACWIAVDCELNVASGVADSDTVFIVADNFFCTYFFGELCIRFFAFKVKRNVFKDPWFAFDLALVLLMVLETWLLPFTFLCLGGASNGLALGDTTLLRTMRLLRITRMARMAKLLRAVPEVIIVIKGIGVALRSVMYTWVLMVAVIYVFAIGFRQISLNTPLGKKHFDGVAEAMYTLLLRGTLPDLADFMTEVGQESIGLAIVLMIFILLVSLTVMNMLIGVLVDVVSVVSKVENYELQVAFVKQKLLGMMESSGLDEDYDHSISRQEFESILVKPEAAKILADLGVDPVGLVDFTDFIFKESECLDFPRFMEVILQLRGSNTATVRDIVDMRKWVAEEFRSLERSVFQCQGRASPCSRVSSRAAWVTDMPRTCSKDPTGNQRKPTGFSPVVGLLSSRQLSEPTRTKRTDPDSELEIKMVKPKRGPPRLLPTHQSGAAASLDKPGMEDDLYDEEV